MTALAESPIEWENELFEDDPKEKWIVKQHIMFLIDASKPMFDTVSNNTTFFKMSIEVCRNIVLNLIKRNKNDKIGIILFGTNDDKKTTPKYINVLKEPSKLNIEYITLLNNLMLADETSYGQSSSMPLKSALQYGNFLINKFNENGSSNTIMLITCNDQPKIGNSKQQFQLRKILDDIIENKIDFKLIPIGSTFNMKMFYDGVLSHFNNISKPTYGLENKDDIMLEINKIMSIGRSVSKIKFFIDKNNYIGTSLFNFYSKSKIPAKVKLDKNTNIPLVSINEVFRIDTNQLMDKTELTKYCVIAQQKIIFNKEDISILKNSVMNPGIKLLGFIDKDKIIVSYHFKTSSFIQPNEDVVEGSTTLFNTLQECCLEKNKVIMCFIKIREGGRIYLSALFPQKEIIDEYGVQKYPSGFHVIYLPFLECLRSIKPQAFDNNLSKITDQQVSIAKQICQKMSIDYYPKLIKNPKINFHWAMLEALALELEPPKVLDETLPAIDHIENNLKSIKNDIITQLFPFDSNLPVVTSTKKRGTFNSNDNKKVIKKKK